MKTEIFKVKVINWFNHNPTKKKTYKKTMISNSLPYDAKINALPLSNKWLFINLLLICGEHGNDTITITQRQVNDILTTREGALNALSRLQSLQLVTFEKLPLNKERNKEIIEITKAEQSPSVIYQNSTQSFQDQCNPNISILETTIEESGFKINPSLKKLLPVILKEFKTPETFNEWMLRIIASKSFESISGKYEKQNYFLGALRNELGIGKNA